MADDGKKDITVKVSYKITKEMTIGEMKKSLEKIPKLEKELDKSFDFSGKASVDTGKNPKDEVQEKVQIASRWPFQLYLTRLGDAFKKAGKTPSDKDLAEIEKRFIKELDQARKDAKTKCEKMIEEIESGKGDNAKALKDGKAAFDKLDNVDFKSSFDKTQDTIAGALKTLASALGGKGEAADAVDDARKAVEDANDDFEKEGKAAIKAISLLLQTANKFKNDKKADGDIKSFCALVLKDKASLEGFDKASTAFAKAIDDVIDKLEDKDIDAATAKKLQGDFEKKAKLGDSAKSVVEIVKKLKPKFEAIEKKLK
jgi:hypothetical protein